MLVISDLGININSVLWNEKITALAETTCANSSELAVIVALLSEQPGFESLELENSPLARQYHDLRY
jgi:hypothetical protein